MKIAAQDRCSGIINDILDFSKIEAGKLDIEKADFRFEDVLDNLSTVVGQKAQRQESGVPDRRRSRTSRRTWSATRCGSDRF